MAEVGPLGLALGIPLDFIALVFLPELQPYCLEISYGNISFLAAQLMALALELSYQRPKGKEVLVVADLVCQDLPRR